MTDAFEKSISRAFLMLEDAQNWLEFKQKMDELGLSDVVGAQGMTLLVDRWQDKQSASLTDKELEDELEHWATGGTYQTHLQGFKAIAPERLVKQAKKRGWFVKPLGGKAIVNVPDRSPFVVPLQTTEKE